MEELLKFVEPLDEAKEENKPLRGGPADQFETGQAWLHYEGEATNCNGGLFLSGRDMSASELFR